MDGNNALSQPPIYIMQLGANVLGANDHGGKCPTGKCTGGKFAEGKCPQPKKLCHLESSFVY